MAPYHDLSGGGTGGAPIPPTPVTLQSAYNNGNTIVETAGHGGHVLLTIDPTFGTYGLSVVAPTGSDSDAAIRISGHGHNTVGEGGGATTTDVLLTAIAQTDNTVTDATLKARAELSVNLVTTWRSLFDGYFTILANAASGGSPNKQVGHLLQAEYWNGAADTSTFALIEHDPHPVAGTAHPFVRVVLGTDNRGAGGQEAIRADSECNNGETLFWLAEKNGGVFSLQRVLVGAPGTGPTGGTTRALYVAV